MRDIRAHGPARGTAVLSRLRLGGIPGFEAEALALPFEDAALLFGPRGDLLDGVEVRDVGSRAGLSLAGPTTVVG